VPALPAPGAGEALGDAGDRLYGTK
jgi:hypothetical protein